ncbi:MAG: hypothetical protein ACXVPQ_13000 [Bacteroidia bacterium]
MKNSIFIIETDSLFSLWLMSMLDDRTKYLMQDYISAEEAYSDIAEFRPKYVIVGYAAGKDANVQTVLIKIKAISPHTDVIVLSKETDVETAIDFLRSGADHFVSKDRNVVRHLLETIH